MTPNGDLLSLTVFELLNDNRQGLERARIIRELLKKYPSLGEEQAEFLVDRMLSDSEIETLESGMLMLTRRGYNELLVVRDRFKHVRRDKILRVCKYLGCCVAFILVVVIVVALLKRG